MIDSSISIPPRLYIDTCVVSAAARNQLEADQASALSTISEWAESSRVSLVASEVVREELERIPARYRAPHLTEYGALGRIPTSRVTYLADDQATVHQEPLYQSLRSFLPDEPDARHIFQAAKSGVSHIITVDQRTILSRATEIQRVAAVGVWSPTEFVSRFSGGFEAPRA